MMRATEIHLNILYEELHMLLASSNMIHADKTPFEVIRDGRSAGNKSYMGATAAEDQRNILSSFILTGVLGKPSIPGNFLGTIPGCW